MGVEDRGEEGEGPGGNVDVQVHFNLFEVVVKEGKVDLDQFFGVIVK